LASIVAMICFAEPISCGAAVDAPTPPSGDASKKQSTEEQAAQYIFVTP
jgi:hypothetical protein